MITSEVVSTPKVALRRRPRNPAAEIFHAAWLAVLLGILLQLALLAIPAVRQSAQLVADFAGKITWSVVVCTSLAAARAATAASPTLTGLLGAPLAFAAAKAVQKSLTAAGVAPAGAALLLIGTRAVEYAILGYLLARLGRRDDAAAKHYLRPALLLGAIAFAVLAIARGDGLGIALLSLAINEIAFPAGCAITIYTAERLARRPPAAP
jgi:GNAT superfamily N-acetyltransferase